MSRVPIIYRNIGVDLEFDEGYIRKRGWRAECTMPSILDFGPFGPQRRMRYSNRDELAELLKVDVKNLDWGLTCWLSEYCIGRWDKIAGRKIEFELEIDAVTYKIFWMEYL